MKAEWHGGPDDGSIIDLPDGTRSIVTPQLDDMQKWQSGFGSLEQTMGTITHPIKKFRRANGTFVYKIIWND